MDDGSLWLWVVLAGLVACSAFFSASETAFSTANKIRLKNLARQGNKKAASALKIAEDYDRSISAILIGNNIVNIGASSIATVLFTTMFGAMGAGISTLVMTLLILVFGEVLPKGLANESPEKFSIFACGILKVCIKVFYPLIFVLTTLKSKFSTLDREDRENAPTVTEQELMVMIEEIEDEGVLEKQESALVRSALEFDETVVNEVLTPRVDVVGIDVDSSIDQVKALFFKEHYSRIPVFEGSLDNILGILSQQDFFISLLKGQEPNLSQLLTKPLYVPPTKKISQLLGDLQREKSHMAVVLDQYGGTLGIVTLEDLLEELVGEIWDEHDEVVQDMVQLSDGSTQITGDCNVYDMLDSLGVDTNDLEIDTPTVGGWVFSQFEYIPKEGESIERYGYLFRVSCVEDQRIVNIIATHQDGTREHTQISE